jgi:hypothetical protein
MGKVRVRKILILERVTGFISKSQEYFDTSLATTICRLALQFVIFCIIPISLSQKSENTSNGETFSLMDVCYWLRSALNRICSMGMSAYFHPKSKPLCLSAHPHDCELQYSFSEANPGSTSASSSGTNDSKPQ